MFADKDIASLNIDDSDLYMCEIEEYDNTLLGDIIEPFLDELIRGLKERFLNDFNTEHGIYNELSYLDMRYLLNIINNAGEENISLKTLCKNMQLQEITVVNELIKFALDFNASYVKGIYSMRATEEILAEDHNDVLYYSMEDDADTELELDGSHIPFETTQCYCMQCVLKYFKEVTGKQEEYQNVFKLYRYVATLPVTEVKCERTFSNMRITKNRLRTLLNDDTLENLIVISDEADLLQKIDLNDVVKDLAMTSKYLACLLL